ncbi:MAG TPA: adenylate/guanylate cyclase domain-containing protein [Clostridia bacterium]|nr:adenylate/guanylate cyclase domain-containing protein [Clostridia bacterium]
MKVKPLFIVFALLLVFSIMLYSDTLSGLESSAGDTVYKSRKPTDTRIVLITIDDESLDMLGQWPWPRSYHAELLNLLAQGKPAVIGIDLIFSEASDPEEDALLSEAIRNAGNVVLASYGNFEGTAKAGSLTPVSIVEPLELLSQYASSGHINVFPEDDGIIRKALTSFDIDRRHVKSFALDIYNRYVLSSGQGKPDPVMPLDPWNRIFIDYVNEPGNFTAVPYSSVLDGSVPPEFFQDRIVLIGPYTVGFNDYYYTSIDKKTPMYGIEIHANIVQNLLYGNFKQQAPFIINLAILTVFCCIGYFSFLKLNPGISAAVVCAAIIIYIFALKLIFRQGYILSIIYPVLAIILTYLVMLAYKYLDELVERRRVTSIFGRYVAPQVVTELLKGGEASLQLGGTRREITVLFVDIRGFTPMSERAQPEEVVAILNDYLDLCARSIFQYGGTLDKFIGDATMAIFNAPLDLEDHAFKAVQTSWAMKQGSEALRKSLEEKFGHSVQFGIGINTGFAIVGNIGSKSRMDYTAIGDTVNTSARLESNAKPGQILISQATYELVKDKISASYLGEISVKGKTRGVQVYQLEGVDTV